jgi:hypothetical protein
MTRLRDEDLNKLERALAEAHRSRQEPSLDADWVRDLMQDVRREAAGPGQVVPFPGIAHTVRRAAAIAAVLALILVGSVLVYTGQDTVELAALLSEEFETGEPLGE